MWYYTIGEEEIGPIPAAELKTLAKEGTIGPNTQVWKEGMAEWTTASKIKGLIPARKKKPQQQKRQQRQRQVVEDYDEYGGYDDDYGAANPYGRPRGRSRGGSGRGRSRSSKPRRGEYDVFTTIFLIVEIVMCLAMAVLFVLLLLAAMNFRASIGVWLQAGITGLIFILGIGGAIQLLRKSAAGVVLAWIAIVLSGIHILIYVFNLIMAIAGMGALDVRGPGAAMGAPIIGGCMFFRVAILVCYAIAVHKASKALK